MTSATKRAAASVTTSAKTSETATETATETAGAASTTSTMSTTSAATLIVAGFGFRSGAIQASLHDALIRALAAVQPAIEMRHITLFATAHDKVEAPCLLALADALGLSSYGVAADRVAAATTTTRSDAVHRLRATGSTAEAAALAAAMSHGGPNAVLLGPRSVSIDRLATCALASCTFVPGKQSPRQAPLSPCSVLNPSTGLAG